jgi:hypothetical protein
MPSVPDEEPERDSFADFEVPTGPGHRAASSLYDRDLHELVGRLLAAAARNSKRVKALAADVRTLRLELRAMNRRQTAWLGGAVVLLQAAFEAWRRVNP